MDNMEYRLRCSGVFMPVKDAACSVVDAEFEESKHPRGEGGKFVSKGQGKVSGSGSSSSKPDFDATNKAIQTVSRHVSATTKGGISQKGELGIGSVDALLSSLKGGSQYNNANLHKITEGLLRDAELSTKQKNVLIKLKKGLEEGASYSSGNVAKLFEGGEESSSSKETKHTPTAQIANRVTKEHMEMNKDAGKLREYTAKKFGPVLFEGGSGPDMQKGKQFVTKLAKMTGQTEKQVMKDLRKDYEGIYGGKDSATMDCAATIQALKERVAKDGGPGSGPRPGGGSGVTGIRPEQRNLQPDRNATKMDQRGITAEGNRLTSAARLATIKASGPKTRAAAAEAHKAAAEFYRQHEQPHSAKEHEDAYQKLTGRALG